MSNLKDMTVKELKEQAKALCDSIYNLECFGTRDLILYDATLAELESRGYEVIERRVLKIIKSKSG